MFKNKLFVIVVLLVVAFTNAGHALAAARPARQADLIGPKLSLKVKPSPLTVYPTRMIFTAPLPARQRG